MRLIGNIVWLLLGGGATAVEYFIASIGLMLTVIGIPFGLQTMKLGLLCLWPFGSYVRPAEGQPGCLSTLMNFIWFFIGGVWICLTHVFFGVLLSITIIGIPFGKQHLKMAHFALTPFGREIVGRRSRSRYGM